MVSASTGNDTSGCGSSVLPCKTIGYAILNVSSSDVIEIQPGTYYEAGIAVSNRNLTLTVLSHWLITYLSPPRAVVQSLYFLIAVNKKARTFIFKETGRYS